MIRIAPVHALRAFALAALLLPGAWAQEAAVVRRATELREAPGDQARSLAPLAAQTAVTRTNERQGPWVQVRTAAGATGWLHLFDVGPATAAATGGGGGAGGALRGVTGLFSSPRTNQTGTTAGIRGLDATDLAQAQPNPAAVAQMESLRQNEAEARSFAERSDLRSAQVAPLPSTTRSTVQPGNSNNPQMSP